MLVYFNPKDNLRYNEKMFLFIRNFIKAFHKIFLKLIKIKFHGGLTNSFFGGEVMGTQEDTMRLIKERHNGIDWCDCFIAQEDTNHFLLNVSNMQCLVLIYIHGTGVLINS